MFNKETWYAIFTFIGLIIGAGIFAIPYVIQQSGFLTGLIDIIILTVVIIYICLCLGEVVLRTKEKHQLTGLSEKYLGKEGKIVMFVSVLIALYGALTAYAIGAGEALSSLFPINPLYVSIAFILILSLITLGKLKFFEKFESIFSPIKILLLVAIIIMTLPFVQKSNILTFNIKAIHIPYGVLIFALSGFSMIPAMAEGLKHKANLKKAIIAGVIISAVIYILFALAVVGTLGSKTTELSTIALGQSLGEGMLILANVFALVALSTAFAAISFALKETYTLDYKMNNKLATVLVAIVPLIFVLISKFSFTKIIEVAGIVGTGTSLLIILIMHSRAIKDGNRTPEFKITNNNIIKGIVILLLILGIVYKFFTLF